VGDLQDKLFQHTQIEPEYQRLVRSAGGQRLDDPSTLLLDSLHWKSGEEILLHIQ